MSNEKPVVVHASNAIFFGYLVETSNDMDKEEWIDPFDLERFVGGEEAICPAKNVILFVNESLDGTLEIRRKHDGVCLAGFDLKIVKDVWRMKPKADDGLIHYDGGECQKAGSTEKQRLTRDAEHKYIYEIGISPEKQLQRVLSVMAVNRYKAAHPDPIPFRPLGEAGIEAAIFAALCEEMK